MTPRAALLPLVLIGLCSLAGCATRADRVSTPPPAVIAAAPCPEPDDPILPDVDGEQSFDELDQYDVIMERDDLLRQHINALRRALDCYRAQAKAL